MNLYRVYMQNNLLNNPFVVASDPNMAYKVVWEWLEEHDYGFESDRILEIVKMIAEKCYLDNLTNKTPKLFIGD